MKLTLWTYEGPTHVGAMRIAASMEGVHFVLHAPQGDTYADLLFTMIERRSTRPPVSYTTFEARDLGQDTATLFRRTAETAIERFAPDVLLVGASCTGELIQDDPAGLSRGLDVPVVALDLPAWQRKENWGASETFYRLVRACAQPRESDRARTGSRPSCNLLGPSALGFRNRDDVREITALLDRLGIAVNVVAPLGATASDLARLGEADFNVVLYPEIADTVARFLEKQYGQPAVRTVPIGVAATREFVRAVASVAALDEAAIAPVLAQAGNLPWWSRSVDATYLTGKRVFVFGDATHAIAAARVASDELGFTVVGLGSYSREQAREVREAAVRLGLEALITDDSLEVEARIAELEPELVLGTQMERHVAKRLGMPCAVISAPFHVEDNPARHSPQMGFEGANVIFDTWVHPLMMGLEEHLLAMFRNDPEFAPEAGPSHLGHAVAAPVSPDGPPPVAEGIVWQGEAERALKRVPVFVRGKARRNTETYARERGIASIDVDTLYAAKAHHAR